MLLLHTLTTHVASLVKVPLSALGGGSVTDGWTEGLHNGAIAFIF